ncbi:energy transducer TonB [Sneathiella marina]|uniref:Energy transducer TonB n=1 Tax=Sneathiella marina TaxID=2950108 RepID=A0ABY4VXH9_9PROT|nr:energy transducer TonB [Sneathiella marina]USG59538.1 energy transducer TonB [Sneathiella marina]
MTLAKPVVTAKIEPVREIAAPVPVPSAPIPIVTQAKATEKIISTAAVPMPRRKPTLSKPVPENTAFKKPIVEPVKLPVQQAEQKVEKAVDVKVLPNKEKLDQPKSKETARANGSGVAGQDASTVLNEARYRHQTSPTYPRRALDMGQQGTVTLHAKVLTNGEPGELKVAQSSGHRLLDRAALSAVKKWKFEPTRVDGSAIVSWVRVPVNFVIQ